MMNYARLKFNNLVTSRPGWSNPRDVYPVPAGRWVASQLGRVLCALEVIFNSPDETVIQPFHNISMVRYRSTGPNEPFLLRI